MATLPNMGIIEPALGGDSGSWDDKLNAALRLIDAHDHTSGKGIPVPAAGIDIDSDLSFHGFTISALGKIDFQAITAPVSGSKSLFVNTSDNELYWRTNGGVNVKLTSGSSINTSLVGGILGDYTSVGAILAYDDANDRYTFKQQSSNPWAGIASGAIQLFETGTTESVYIRIKVPAALAGSYDITLPAALPGSQSIVQIDSAGQLVFSNTVPQAIVCSSTVTATDYKFTTDKTQTFAAWARGVELGGSVHTRDSIGWTLGNSSNAVIVSLDLPVGSRITSFTAFAVKGSGNTVTVRAGLFRLASGAGSYVQIGSYQSSNATGNITLTQSGLTEDVSAGRTYAITFNASAGDPTGDVFQYVVVTYTRP